MSISELQEWVKNDWDKNSSSIPSVQQQILYVIEELGEVAEAIRKNAGQKERIDKKVDLGSELADLLISIVTLSNTYEINLEYEIEQFKIRLNERR